MLNLDQTGILRHRCCGSWWRWCISVASQVWCHHGLGEEVQCCAILARNLWTAMHRISIHRWTRPISVEMDVVWKNISIIYLIIFNWHKLWEGHGIGWKSSLFIHMPGELGRYLVNYARLEIFMSQDWERQKMDTVSSGGSSLAGNIPKCARSRTNCGEPLETAWGALSSDLQIVSDVC